MVVIKNKRFINVNPFYIIMIENQEDYIDNEEYTDDDIIENLQPCARAGSRLRIGRMLLADRILPHPDGILLVESAMNEFKHYQKSFPNSITMEQITLCYDTLLRAYSFMEPAKQFDYFEEREKHVSACMDMEEVVRENDKYIEMVIGWYQDALDFLEKRELKQEDDDEGREIMGLTEDILSEAYMCEKANYLLEHKKVLGPVLYSLMSVLDELKSEESAKNRNPLGLIREKIEERFLPSMEVEPMTDLEFLILRFTEEMGYPAAGSGHIPTDYAHP